MKKFEMRPHKMKSSGREVELAKFGHFSLYNYKEMSEPFCAYCSGFGHGGTAEKALDSLKESLLETIAEIDGLLEDGK